jgi:hypothetical protein
MMFSEKSTLIFDPDGVQSRLGHQPRCLTVGVLSIARVWWNFEAAAFNSRTARSISMSASEAVSDKRLLRKDRHVSINAVRTCCGVTPSSRQCCTKFRKLSFNFALCLAWHLFLPICDYQQADPLS